MNKFEQPIIIYHPLVKGTKNCQTIEIIYISANFQIVDELKIIISLYQDEKASLEQRFTECIQESEYLTAYYLSKAINQLNLKLGTLHGIDDPSFHEKLYHRKRIQDLEKEMKSERYESIKARLLRELDRQKEILNDLNVDKTKISTSNQEFILNDLLIKLVNFKVKTFRLILNKSAGFHMVFSYTGRNLKARIPYLKKYIKNSFLHPYQLTHLKNLGFQMTEKGTALVLIITGERSEVIDKVTFTLSRMVFEIFYKRFENETFIQYNDNTLR